MSNSAAYLRPHAVEDAIDALAREPRTVVAGGTDFYPARVGRPLDERVLDITALPGLRGLDESEAGYRLGALTTWSDLVRNDLPACFHGLQLAAREVGGVQIQNAGTVAGNICNASPAADGVPALLTLDASVELRSTRGTRSVALDAFILGNRRVDRADDELVTGFSIPKPPPASVASFTKLGARRYLVISIVMVAGLMAVDEAGRVAALRLAIGACSATARRLHELESALLGKPADGTLAALVEQHHLTPIAPIDDVRASAAYRRDAARTLVARMLAELVARAAATPGVRA